MLFVQLFGKSWNSLECPALIIITGTAYPEIPSSNYNYWSCISKESNSLQSCRPSCRHLVASYSEAAQPFPSWETALICLPFFQLGWDGQILSRSCLSLIPANWSRCFWKRCMRKTCTIIPMEGQKLVQREKERKDWTGSSKKMGLRNHGSREGGRWGGWHGWATWELVGREGMGQDVQAGSSGPRELGSWGHLCFATGMFECSAVVWWFCYK